jgi:hypothetical protein
MRLALIGLPLLAVALACNAAPKKRKNADTTQPLDRTCKVDDCFLERDVRDFEVIDQTTVIVYVGSQNCAFRVEVHGTFCDLTFAPELYFHSPGDFERNNVQNIAGAAPPLSRPLGDIRICSNDTGISVDGGAFTENPTSTQPPDRYGNRRSECRITSVTSMTDDEILELYVDHGVTPPPPPMGSGKIEVGEQKEETTGGAAPAGDTPAAKTEADEGASAQPDSTAASN